MIVLLLTKVAESLLYFLAILSILSDFGTKDGYVAILKYSIELHHSDVHWVDLSHSIEPYNLQEAAIVLKNALPHFPAGSIHWVAMENHPEGSPKNYLALSHKGQFFFLPDNGIYTLLTDEPPETCALIGAAKGPFGSLEVVSAKLSAFLEHRSIDQLGPAHQPLRLLGRQVRLTRNEITGTVLYTDHFGNLHTNISIELFEKFRQERAYFIKIGRFDLQKISEGYSAVSPGELLALWNTAGMLEIAIAEGRASNLLGLKPDSPIFIQFIPEI